MNEAMKLAAVRAIADLAMAEQNDRWLPPYGTVGTLSLGRST